MSFTTVAPTTPRLHRSELTVAESEGEGVVQTAKEQSLMSAATTGSVPRR
jgi:hypothetical protein